MTTLLIDGDIVIYKAACVAETPINWGDGIWTLHTNEEEAQAISRSYVENITKKLKADK
ncbi:MAG: exonuclease, partial [Desulfobacterales bacterium]|nr:exonuclease [Desulfobacterales bacterium]